MCVAVARATPYIRLHAQLERRIGVPGHAARVPLSASHVHAAFHVTGCPRGARRQSERRWACRSGSQRRDSSAAATAQRPPDPNRAPQPAARGSAPPPLAPPRPYDRREHAHLELVRVASSGLMHERAPRSAAYGATNGGGPDAPHAHGAARGHRRATAAVGLRATARGGVAGAAERQRKVRCAQSR